MLFQFVDIMPTICEEEEECDTNNEEGQKAMILKQLEIMNTEEMKEKFEKEIYDYRKQPVNSKKSRIPVPTLTKQFCSGNTRPRLLNSSKSRIPVPIHTRKNKDEAQRGNTAENKNNR